YFNKKYEKYFKKEEEERGALLRKYGIPIHKYGVSAYKIDDKAKWSIDSHPKYGLPWITIFNGMLTVGIPRFWSTDNALREQYNGDYKTFLKILDELEHKENWKKYKNDKLFGNEIFLYEQADETARKVNKKYGTNIVFHGGEDCWFDTTFSIKDKSEDEVIKEIERNIGPLYEANEKACKIILGYGIDFIFSESTPKDVVEQIKEKYKGTSFPGKIPVVLRYKQLKYLPIVLETSMLGPQEVGDESLFTFKKAGWTWSSEDQRIFEELKNKVETRIEKRKWSRLPYKGEQDHVFWSAEVLELKEVREEIKTVRKGKLFSSEDKDDVELLESARLTNKDIKFYIDKLCKTINDIKKKVGSSFLFALTYW
ncbi:MAG: hypothetical protein ACP5LN_10160, partial [Thermoproteota archaeon]